MWSQSEHFTLHCSWLLSFIHTLPPTGSFRTLRWVCTPPPPPHHGCMRHTHMQSCHKHTFMLHTVSLSLTYAHCSHAVSLSLSLSHTHTLSLTHTQSHDAHMHSLSLSHTHTLSLSHSHDAHMQSFSPSLSHTHTRTHHTAMMHTCTISPSPPPPSHTHIYNIWSDRCWTTEIPDNCSSYS